MRILIAGANGRIGTRLISLLQKQGHIPVAMIRDASQATKFDAQGVESVVGDLEHPLEHVVKNIDAIIFAAGSGSQSGKDKTIFVDHLGAIRLAATAEFAHVRRFIMVSSIGATPDSQHPTIAHYHHAKAQADHFLKSRDLDWTIVKPGRLVDRPGTGKVALNTTIGEYGEITLDDTAAVVAQCIDHPSTIRLEFQATQGETPIAEAIATLA